MASKKRNPTVFHKDILYKTWKNKLQMWELITSVPKKEQGIIVLLDALEGNAKADKAVADIKANELNVENGLKLITDKLDKIFLEETADKAYEVYSDFSNYNKTVEMTVSECVLKF